MTLPYGSSPDYAAFPPPSGRRRWAISEILAWAVVLLLAALAAVSAAMEQRQNAPSPAKEGMFTFVAQYLVGVHEIGKGGSFGGAPDAQLLRELEDAAKTPEDRVRLAIVAGEILGREESLKRLDALTDAGTAGDVASARTVLAGDDLPADAWQAFRARYEWFADLAQSVGKPADDPLRAQTLNAAFHTFWTYLGFLGAALVATVIGLALLVVGIVLLCIKKMQTAFRNTTPPGLHPADRRAYLQGFACYLAGMIVFGLLLHVVLKFTLHNVSPMAGMAAEFCGLGMAFGLGALWPLLMGQTRPQWQAALGVHKGRGVFREMLSGMLGYLAGLPVIAAGLIVTTMLAKAAGMTGGHPINDELTRGIGWILVVFVLASVWAPVTEELMFRGALFAHLRERFGWWISAPVVAVVFAIIHPQGWVALPVLGAIALVLAGIREWRGSIIGCITAHSLHNTLTLAFALTMLAK